MNYELIKPINQDYTVIQQILTNRGIDFKDIEHYLNVSEQDNLSPIKLKYIENAAKILIKHLLNPDTCIDLIVDADADGYLSSALVLNYLYARWPSSINKIHYILHESKIHGIELEKLSKDVTLVLVPDAGSNQYDIHQELRDRGVDVLILDHHIAERISEYACVVNNQLCDYPNKTLCGCGIVYKLCQYIDYLLEDEGFVDSKFLDIVAVSLVSDMMDLRSFETHYLIQEGLKQLRNPFIKGMAEKNAYSIGDALTPIGVAFYITPLINAITRVGTMEEKEILFQSMLDHRAYKMIASTKRGHKNEEETLLEQSLRICTNVKNRQTKQQDIAVEQIEQIIKRDNLTAHKVMVVKVENPDFDLSITGLIANKIMGKYCQPICLIHPSKDEEGIWIGSMRACGISDFRSFCENSGFVEWCQGHPLAAGFCIQESQIDAFINYCDTKFKDTSFTPNYKVDFIYNSSSINPKDILEIGSYNSLWGQNLGEPLIVIENLPVTKDMIQLMSRNKNPTLKIELPSGVSCIKFKSSDEEFDNLYSESGCAVITIIGRCAINKYLDRITPQIIIQDYQIIEKQDYYF